MNDNVKHTHNVGIKPKDVKLKNNYRFYNRTFIFLLVSNIIIFLTVIFIYPVKKLLWGYRFKGKENFKKIPSAITICNHVTVQDGFTLVPSLYPKKVYVTTIKENLGYPIASRFLRFCGAVPIPDDPKLFIRFIKDTKNILNKNKYVQIYPEGSLEPYCDHLRAFLPGAFHIAYLCKKPIIPLVTTFNYRKGIYKFKKKPCITLTALKPYYIDYTLPKKEAMLKAENDLFNIMNDFFNKESVTAT